MRSLSGEQGLELVNAGYPSGACVSPRVKVGAGVVIAKRGPQALVGTDTELEDYVIINTSAVVDHECHIARACCISARRRH